MSKTKSAAEKMGIKEGARTLLMHIPDDALDALSLPVVNPSRRMSGVFDYIHIFLQSQSELDKRLNKIKNHLSSTGMLWISWPKAGKLDTDLNMKHVIRIGYNHGLVESKALSVDQTWSALKFTWPKKGKKYNNSFGKLKTSV